MRPLFRWLIALGLLFIAAGWVLSRPATVSEADLAGIEPDLARGEEVFWATGCASCHAADGAEGDEKLVLSGGHRLESPFGTFVAPNISQDPDHGIGDWTTAEIVTAVMEGTSPDGQHYYPAFPYAAYGKADLADIVSLAAFLKTLPADPTPSAPHELGFPFTIRAGLGGWKWLFVTDDFALPAETPQIERGRYLAEALGHCAECHTPRNALGGLDTARWFAGATNPSGRGNIPNITPAKLTWTEADIAAYLKSGFTPEFDTAGGSMTAVIAGTSKLSDEDRAAIAAYVKSAPARE